MNRCQMRLYARSILRSYRNRATGAIGTPVCGFGILNDQLRCVFIELCCAPFARTYAWPPRCLQPERRAPCLITVLVGIPQGGHPPLEIAVREAPTLA